MTQVREHPAKIKENDLCVGGNYHDKGNFLLKVVLNKQWVSRPLDCRIKPGSSFILGCMSELML